MCNTQSTSKLTQLADTVGLLAGYFTKRIRGGNNMSKKAVTNDEAMEAMETPVKKAVAVKMVEPTVIEFTALLACSEKAEFEEVIKPLVSAEDNADILSLEDVALLKRGHANAVLTFRENMSRFVESATSYAETVAAHQADPNDPTCEKACLQLTNRLQKYTNKMCAYASQIASYVERLTQIAPEELAPKRKAKEAPADGADVANEAEA